MLELWIRHCRFLVKRGEFEASMKVFDRAMRLVDDTDSLQTQYRLLVTQ